MPKAKKAKVTGPVKVETMEEYLARGGTVTVCEPGARTEDLYIGQWGRKKASGAKKAAAKADTEK